MKSILDRLFDRDDPVIQIPTSIDSPEFRGGFGKALAEHGEAQVLVRYARAQGMRRHFLFTRAADFEVLMKSLSPGDSVTVSLSKPYPLRGTQDNLDEMLGWFKGSNTEIAVLPTDPNTEVEVIELADMNDNFNAMISVGHALPFWLPNGEVAVTGYVPNADGTITPSDY